MLFQLIAARAEGKREIPWEDEQIQTCFEFIGMYCYLIWSVHERKTHETLTEVGD